jgi:integrase
MTDVTPAPHKGGYRKVRKDGNPAKKRENFGAIRKRASGRYQASYFHQGKRWTAPETFATLGAARTWLAKIQSQISDGVWVRPDAPEPPPPVTVADYAASWMAGRTLTPQTRALYQGALDRLVLPALGGLALEAVTPQVAASWFASLDRQGSARNAQAWRLCRAIFNEATRDGTIARCPFQARGNGAYTPITSPRVLTVAETDHLISCFPPHRQAAAVIALWCGLRGGEIRELRRRDITIEPDNNSGTTRVSITVTRAVTETRTSEGLQFHIGSPKTNAGNRTVPVPNEYANTIISHLETFTPSIPDALLFRSDKGEHITRRAWVALWARATTKANIDGFTAHHARHNYVSRLAGANASQALGRELVGHASEGITRRYQHALPEEAWAVADRLVQAAKTSDPPSLRVINGQVPQRAASAQ